MNQTHVPDPDTVAQARSIAAELPTGELHIDGVPTALPASAAAMLREILTALAAGEPVAIITQETELSPNEVAEILNVSRGFVTKLMDEGALPFRQVGSHRRIPGAALAVYRAKQQTVARTAMDELVAISEGQGAYADPPDIPPKTAFRTQSGRAD